RYRALRGSAHRRARRRRAGRVAVPFRGPHDRRREAGPRVARHPGAECGVMETLGVDDVTFDDRGLVPAVIQDAENGDVLMVAWMNREALERTLADGRTWFWSRSRQELWAKGETSGHVQ